MATPTGGWERLKAFLLFGIVCFGGLSLGVETLRTGRATSTDRGNRYSTDGPAATVTGVVLLIAGAAAGVASVLSLFARPGDSGGEGRLP